MKALIDKFIFLPFNQIFIVAAVIGGLYFYLYFDMGTLLDSQIEQTQREISAEEVRKKETEALLKKEEILKNKSKQMITDVAELQKRVPVEQKHSDLIILVSNFAKQLNLKVVSATQGGRQRLTYFEKLDINIEISGKYNDLMMFASNISNDDQVLKLENIEFTRQQQTSSNPANSDGLLSLKAKLIGYKQIGDTRAEAQANVK